MPLRTRLATTAMRAPRTRVLVVSAPQVQSLARTVIPVLTTRVIRQADACSRRTRCRVMTETPAQLMTCVAVDSARAGRLYVPALLRRSALMMQLCVLLPRLGHALAACARMPRPTRLATTVIPALPTRALLAHVLLRRSLVPTAIFARTTRAIRQAAVCSRRTRLPVAIATHAQVETHALPVCASVSMWLAQALRRWSVPAAQRFAPTPRLVLARMARVHTRQRTRCATMWMRAPLTLVRAVRVRTPRWSVPHRLPRCV